MAITKKLWDLRTHTGYQSNGGTWSTAEEPTACDLDNPFSLYNTESFNGFDSSGPYTSWSWIIAQYKSGSTTEIYMAYPANSINDEHSSADWEYQTYPSGSSWNDTSRGTFFSQSNPTVKVNGTSYNGYIRSPLIDISSSSMRYAHWRVYTYVNGTGFKYISNIDDMAFSNDAWGTLCGQSLG